MITGTLPYDKEKMLEGVYKMLGSGKESESHGIVQSVMQQRTIIAFDKKKRGIPMRDVSFFLFLLKGKIFTAA